MPSWDYTHTYLPKCFDTDLRADMGLRRLRCGHSFLALGYFVLFTAILAVVILFYQLTQKCHSHYESWQDKRRSYDRNTTPLIFIGGWPRSGTTLMRVMLDAHPDVRCGEETQLIPMVLNKLMEHRKKTYGAQRLLEAGITDDLLYSAVGKFILELIVGHGEPATRLCNKDPFALEHMPALASMFPLGQFLLMIRDGRAVCHSIASRNVGIARMDPKNLTQCLEKWSRMTKKMYNDCLTLGRLKCLPVRYEQLVLHPRTILTNILVFLKVPWNDVVLHHEKEINKPGGISLSRMEPSTDQVIKPINIDSLTKWSNFIPNHIRQKMRQIAPMLEILGYDPGAYPPNYGHPDKEVEENSLFIQKNLPYFKHLAWTVRNRSKPIIVSHQ